MYKEKINRIVIGTNNQGKVREIKKLLSKGVKIDTPKKLYIKSPKENGTSFLVSHNFLLKSLTDKWAMPYLHNYFDYHVCVSIWFPVSGVTKIFFHLNHLGIIT